MAGSAQGSGRRQPRFKTGTRAVQRRGHGDRCYACIVLVPLPAWGRPTLRAEQGWQVSSEMLLVAESSEWLSFPLASGLWASSSGEISRGSSDLV